MPVQLAEYFVLLARALPGTPLAELEWGVSLVRGWCFIHAAGILDGNAYIWPDARLSRVGRRLLRLQSMRDKGHRWKVAVDL